MTNNPKVSIIMPIYNGEKFLKTALDSAVNQTLKEIELICINDGSTDNSLKILEDYAKNDDRIKIYSQKNKGQGAAQNYGISMCTGQYAIFLAQDDFLENNACEIAYENAIKNNVDLVIFAAETFSEVKKDEGMNKHLKVYKKIPNFENKVFNLCDLNEYVVNIPIAPWIKIYKKNLLNHKDLRLTENVLFDDINFFLTLLSLNPKTLLIRDTLYHYNYPREGQVTQSQGFKILSIFKSFNNFEKTLSNLGQYSFVKRGVIRLKFHHMFYWFSMTKWYVKVPYFFKLRQEFIKLYLDGWTDNDVKQILPLDTVYAFMNFNFIKIFKQVKR